MSHKRLKIAELMQNSGVRFGTSGARGLARDMTDEVCYAYTIAFIQYLEGRGDLKGRGRIAIGGDLRQSTERIMKAVIKAVYDRDYTPENCGLLPSPAIAHYGFMKNIPSIMVTGSHIPEDRNGIKYTKADGEILKHDEAGIREQVVEIPDGLFDESGMLTVEVDVPDEDDGAVELYIRRYLDAFGGAPLKGLRIGLYQHSAVGRDITTRILESLGAEVTPFGRSETFIPVDTEAIRQEDIKLASEWAKEYGFDSIVSTDGDGDRPMISDEHGRWLRGDVAGILCARFLEADALVTPVSSNTAVERCGLFKKVYRTRIGSPYVIEGMMQALRDGYERVVGYEANGGFLTGSDIQGLKALPTRDAMLPIISILITSVQEGKRLGQLVEALPRRFTASDRLREFPTERSVKMLRRLKEGGIQVLNEIFGVYLGSVSYFDTTDGLRIYFENGEIVHLRPSGNAPEFRCYTEADTEERATEIRDICLKIMEGWRRD